MGFTKKCRACLENFDAQQCVDLTAPFDDCYTKPSSIEACDKLSHLEVFNECTQLGVQLECLEALSPKAPDGCRHLCSACSNELRNAYQFIVKARYSHILLSPQTAESSNVRCKEEEQQLVIETDFQYLDEALEELDEEEELPANDNVAHLGVEQALAEIFGLESCEQLPNVELDEENVDSSKLMEIKNELSEQLKREVGERSAKVPDESKRSVENEVRVDKNVEENNYENEDEDDDAEDDDDEDATSIEVRLVASDDNEDEPHLMLEYKCELCMARFDFQRDLVQHYDSYHDQKDLHHQCSSCDHRFFTKSSLNTHVRQIHQNCEYLDCRQCGRTVLKSFFKVHQRRHSKQKKFLCAECPSTFSSNYTLKKHLRIHSKDRDRNIECEQCGRRFFTPEAFRTHQITHQDPASRATFNCSLCSKSFMRQTNLKLHMQMHRGETMDCPHCGKQFVRRKDLEIHIRFHTGEFPFVCRTCGRRFAIKGHLTAHEKKHKGIKYQCNQCDKQFINVAGLRQHAFEHTGMPLFCGVCQKGFPTRFKVRRHLRSVHHSMFGDDFKDADAEQYIKTNLLAQKHPRHLAEKSETTEGGDVYELEILEEDADDLVDYIIEEI